VTDNKYEITREWFWRDEFRVKFADGRLIRNARIPKKAPTTTTGVLNRAADIIEQKGLARGVMRDERGCRCLYAAILEAVGLSYNLDEEIDVGHLDARQIDLSGRTIGRFALLQDTLARLGLPNCWGHIELVAPLARWSDKRTPGDVVRMLREAAAGRALRWESRILNRHQALELLR
jgi:hypothetical protein